MHSAALAGCTLQGEATPTENAPDLAAEGVHIYWSTRPGSLAGFARFALAEQSSAAKHATVSAATPTLAKGRRGKK
jgi:hypothetical protein